MNDSDRALSRTIDEYMSRTIGLKEHCGRCLETMRWGGSVVLMVVDAAFTSIGLNYFTAVVPSVLKFEREFVANGKVRTLGDLSTIQLAEVQHIWKNRRSWEAAKNVAACLNELAIAEGLDDREALRRWAASSFPESWSEDPLGKIGGVGITTFQYLRMMGGTDTAMPDKIVRRVVKQILDETGIHMPIQKDLELINTIECLARLSDYRPIEICWMTWMIQPEGDLIRMQKYRELLNRI